MNLMREAVLWAAGNHRLERSLTRRRFVERTVRRFMPGESLGDVLPAAERLRGQGLPSTVTFLGEDVRTHVDVDATVREYERALGEIAERRLDTEASVKPSQLGLTVSEETAMASLERLATTAARGGNRLWLDMESHARVDATVRLFERLREQHENVGICLQAYLRRTPGDLQRLLPSKPSVRLVKGAYREPADLLVGGRGQIDAAFRRLAAQLVETRQDEMHVVLGTHDLELIGAIERDVLDLGFDRSHFEVAMLYGIRSDAQRALSARGYQVRTLISYGTHWYPWFMRRIAEKPIANTTLALKNLRPNVRGSRPADA
jgi:proline dehydrogenase